MAVRQRERLGRAIAPNEVEPVAGWLEENFGSPWARAVALWLRDYLREHLETAQTEAGKDEVQSSEMLELSPRLALEEFVEWAHSWRPEQNGVIVLTAHSSKGLEFDNVVVCDCDWLHTGSITGADRRLFYVAATRARHSLSLVTSSFMRTAGRMVSIEKSEHLVPLDLVPHNFYVEAQSRAPLTPCSVRDVFLSFPAWSGPRCHQSLATRQKTAEVVDLLKPGDQLRIKKTADQSDLNPWHVYAHSGDGWHHIGKMQRNFRPEVSDKELYAEVFALVLWRKQDSESYHQDKIHRERWFTVIPEWGPVK